MTRRTGRHKRPPRTQWGSWESCAETDAIFDGLVTSLDTPGAARAAAAKVIKRFGVTEASPGELAWLTRELRSSDSVARYWAKRTVSELGDLVATPSVLDTIAKLMRDPKPELRRYAAEVVGELGQAAAYPAIRDRLPKMLRDSDPFVQSQCLVSISELGRVAATPDVLNRLSELLRDSSHLPYFGQQALLRTAHWVGNAPTATTGPRRPADSIRPRSGPNSGAMDASDHPDGEAPTHSLASPLFEWLRNPELWSEAAQAIGALSGPQVPKGFLDALANVLRGRRVIGVRPADMADDFRMRLLVAVFRLRSKRTNKPFGLSALLHYANEDVLIKAIDAVEALGPKAATPAILERLPRLLRDEFWIHRETQTVQAAAASAVGVFMQSGYRFFRRSWGRWKVYHIDDLSRLEKIV